MFRIQAKDANSIAAARWQELVDTLGSTEAGRRASTAWDVLHGRRVSAGGWPMIRAIVVGVAVGWAASEFYRRRKPEIDQTVEKMTDKMTEQLTEAKHTVDDRIARAKATPGTPMEKVKAAVGANATERGL